MSDNSGLDVIIVTAQKREQSIQDVPIAVTALGQDTLQANRVTDVTNLTGLAPGLSVKTSAGGSKIPAFQIRGANSFGVVPGSDKEVSIYIDGVYISSPRGSIFDLPDIERIEVLRGPQGTLFGRNATAGAISVATRDPTGEVGLKGSVSVGNRDSLRTRASIDLPQWGPFSAYVSYVHEERRGDIRNLGAGEVWDRTAAQDREPRKVQTSPEWLGNKNTESVFAAIKFEPTDNFSNVYKFDWNQSHDTAEGTALVGYDASAPLIGNLVSSLIESQAANGFPAVPIDADGKRPREVLNSWVVPSQQKVQGHSLTSTLQLGGVSLKNIAAFRKTYVFATSSIDGVSALHFTPQALVPYATLVAFSTLPPEQATGAIPVIAQQLQPLIGQPFIGIASQAEVRSKQYSDELQLNYESGNLAVTAGAVWFYGTDYTAQHRLQNTISFAPVPSGILTNSNIGLTYNKQTSIAAYGQIEYDITDAITLVGGARVTRDKKSGYFEFGPDLASLQRVEFDYKKTKPSFLVGVNYQPTPDLLIYGKFSTAYVSGGSVAGVAFEEETARSFEGGVKAQLFDRKVRTSLALYQVTYKHLQTPQSATGAFANIVTAATGDPTRASSIGTFVFDIGGPVKAKGIEFEFTAAPTQGLTVGGNLAYTDTDFTDVDPLLCAVFTEPDGSCDYVPTLRPPWTANLYGQYDTKPLFGHAYVSARLDGVWQDTTNFAQNPAILAYSTYAKGIKEEKAYWVVNGRLAVKDLNLGGINGELAIWGNNIFDQKAKVFTLDIAETFATANFIPARRYGVELTVRY